MAYRDSHCSDNTVRYSWLVEFMFASPLRLTNAPVSLSYGGNTYSNQYKVDVTALGYGQNEITEANVTVSNGDAAIGTVVQALSGSERYTPVNIYEVWLDATTTDTTIQDSYTLIAGRMESPEWDSEQLTFRVVPAVSAVATKFPSGQYVTPCRYRVYKGSQCGSTGTDPTCDRLWTSCISAGKGNNGARFGGFRHKPAPGQVFWWGNGSFSLPTRPK